MQIPADVRTYQSRAARYTGVRGPWLEHLVEDMGLTFEQATQAIDGWECIPYIDEHNGHMATLIKKNKEVHFAIYRRFRSRGNVNRRRLTGFLQPILDKEVFLVTKVFAGEDTKFITHLGFQPLGVTLDGSFQTFILNDIRYPRARPCK